MQYSTAMEPIPWNQEFTLENEHYRAFRIGDLCLVIAKRNSEWYIASFREQVMPFPEEGLRADLSNKELGWSRWEGSEEDSKFMLRPALPPIPVISRPAEPVTLPPGAKSRFFIGIPAFVEIVAECGGEQMVLLSAPMTKVTFTWRGIDTPSGESKAEGEVCLSLRTKAHRFYLPEKIDPGYIISTVEISNHRKTPLPFSRIRLDTDYLSVFKGENHAWTNSCRLSSFDDKSKDAVVYSSSPSHEAGENVLISPPRKDHNRKVKKAGVIDSFIDKFKFHV